MTDKPTPTDAELKDMWGQPVVAGDVDRADAVNLARNALTQYDCAITKKGVRVLAEAVLSMDSALTTQQPTQTQPVAREPLPKFLALKFHARRDKKATVTLLFPGHEAADAWVRGIKGGQHGAE